MSENTEILLNKNKDIDITIEQPKIGDSAPLVSDGAEMHIAEKLAEKFLSDHATLEKYKHMVDSAFCGQAICNRLGKMIYGNKFYMDMVGVDSPEEVLGDGWHKVVSCNGVDRFICIRDKYLRNKIPKFQFVGQYKNLKTGEVFSKKIVFSVIADNGYGINILPVDFEVPDDFVQAILD